MAFSEPATHHGGHVWYCHFSREVLPWNHVSLWQWKVSMLPWSNWHSLACQNKTCSCVFMLFICTPASWLNLVVGMTLKAALLKDYSCWDNQKSVWLTRKHHILKLNSLHLCHFNFFLALALEIKHCTCNFSSTILKPQVQYAKQGKQNDCMLTYRLEVVSELECLGWLNSVCSNRYISMDYLLNFKCLNYACSSNMWLTNCVLFCHAWHMYTCGSPYASGMTHSSCCNEQTYAHTYAYFHICVCQQCMYTLPIRWVPQLTQYIHEYSSDDWYIAAGSSQVRLFDLATGKLLREYCLWSSMPLPYSQMSRLILVVCRCKTVENMKNALLRHIIQPVYHMVVL